MATELLVLGGERTAAAGGRSFTVVEPATGGPLAEVAEAGAEDSRRAADLAGRVRPDPPPLVTGGR